MMEIWLDTIDFKIIEDANKLGVLVGVTTNPSILSEASENPETIIKKLLNTQPGKVAVQTTETELLSIVSQSRRIAKISERIIIKIPAVNDGFRAIAVLEKEGIATLATTIFETRQIILSGMVGATYAAPYFNRIELATQNALSIIGDAQKIIESNQYKTKIMVAAVRTAEQFTQCAKMGVGAITLPVKAYQELFASNADIDKSLEKFSSMWLSNNFTATSPLFFDK